MKNKGYHIICLEITSESKPIHLFKVPIEKPIALMIGDENFGISEPVLKLSDSQIHIDMFGKNSSMNVVQAASLRSQ